MADRDKEGRGGHGAAAAGRGRPVLYIIWRYKSHPMSRRGEMKIEIPGRHCSIKTLSYRALRIFTPARAPGERPRPAAAPPDIAFSLISNVDVTQTKPRTESFSRLRRGSDDARHGRYV
ncbi:hypothetical protein EVAR_28026_1 [Eumeta japonica]|uniref:Uncharacterized protein n=1 Tax=Eumeta variegata TaxID=151549 RepID=A0A4C1WCL5_EUMVA|nr:hypothetical protein EVAR_28026_1 [Eumeta japonica]